jgi:methionyl-tRNA synthetase
VLFEEDYEGLYCEGCEGFKQEKDLDARALPDHRTQPKKIRESNFFFRLSEYDDALLKHLAGASRVHRARVPPQRGGQRDPRGAAGRQRLAPNCRGASAARGDSGRRGHTVVRVGRRAAQLPVGARLAGAEVLAVVARKKATSRRPGAARQDEFQQPRRQGRPGAAWAGTAQPLYTNAFHLIGKDISRFHCVLWPALLLAAGVPLPRQVYVHGFIYARGERLSKSLGNVVDPVELANRFGVDALRFYLIDAIPTGRDGEFTLEQFVEHVQHASREQARQSREPHDHARAQVLRRQGAGEWAPDAFADPAAREALDALVAAAAWRASRVPRRTPSCGCNEALEHVWNVVERANEFTDRAKPWESGKDPRDAPSSAPRCRRCSRSLRLVAIWAWPVIPRKSERLWDAARLPGTPLEARGERDQPRYGAGDGRALGASEILFPRIDLEAATKA